MRRDLGEDLLGKLRHACNSVPYSASSKQETSGGCITLGLRASNGTSEHALCDSRNYFSELRL